MRLLICGDRDYWDYEFILNHLRALNPPPEVVITGAARGADKLAEKAAAALDIPVQSFPAQWDVYGKKAGPLRNTQMLKEGLPTHVWAFHDNLPASKGTKNMVGQATKAGLPVQVITHADNQLAAEDADGRRVVPQSERNEMGFKLLKKFREDVVNCNDLPDHLYMQEGDALVIALVEGRAEDPRVTLYDCVIKHSKEYSKDDIREKKI